MTEGDAAREASSSPRFIAETRGSWHTMLPVQVILLGAQIRSSASFKRYVSALRAT